MKFNKGTPDELVALRNVSLNIQKHQFVTVIGTNGSGKSTLLNVLAGNIFPDTGMVRIAGKNVTRKPDYKRAGSIARVFQNPYSGTAPAMTIAENLLMAWFRGKKRYPVFSMTGKLKSFLRDQLTSLDMQLENRMEHVVGTLSGGQRQAITLLMAVLQTPRVLLLDEHTAALDPKTAAQVIRLTERFISEHQLTTLMVTHSMKQALEMGNRTIMMHHGMIIEDIGMKEKAKLTVEDLLSKFEDIRKQEKLTPQLIKTMQNQYV